jgi:hypothetical protein
MSPKLVTKPKDYDDSERLLQIDKLLQNLPTNYEEMKRVNQEHGMRGASENFAS